MVAYEYMEKRAKKTFLMPFVVLVSFVAPSLAVTAYVKPTAGYDALLVAGWFIFVQLIVGLIAILATACGIVYLIRAEGKGGRAAILVTTLVLWAAFWYSIR